jgi:hypothetical protein
MNFNFQQRTHKTKGAFMKILILISFVVSIAMGAPVFAKGEAKKAEAKMMAACKKEYPAAVKGKKMKEVGDWVETEERGANAETFKKSQCYNLHEDWEKAAGHNEADEEHETK